MTLRVLHIDTPSLGDRSYLVHDGTTAMVIDPQRDIDRIVELLKNENLTLGAIIETHIHNDYVSGGLELARLFNVQYLINEDDGVAFEHRAISDQQVFPIGTFAIKALHTPGHTFTHMSYLLLGADDHAQGVFTGGSLLHGSTGRPDLLGWNKAPELAGLQYKSAKMLSDALEDGVDIYPTHGFGSFCSATPSLTDTSNMGDEKRTNPVLLLDEELYIATTLASLDTYPTYFKYMGPINTAGAQHVDLSDLTEMSTDEILTALKAGAWVVDLRNRKAWASEHILGSASLGIDGSLASYLGWLYPYGKDLFLLSDKQSDVRTAQRELVRIGIDRPTGSFVGSLSPFSAKSSIQVATFFDLPGAMKDSKVTLLDVRQVHERAKSHIEPSIFIPFYEVESRVNELPQSGEIWVHCASGYRAASIVGFIESSGRTPVLIDDEYESAKEVKGIPIVSSSA